MPEVGSGRLFGRVKALGVASRQEKTRRREAPGLNGRSRVIRTLDPLLPKQVAGKRTQHFRGVRAEIETKNLVLFC